MTRMRCVFTGRVQGVGFRANARAIARGFPVTGWVRNEPDGSVALEVQGADDDVHAFLGALRARMAGLIRSERSNPTVALGGESAFEISR